MLQVVDLRHFTGGMTRQGQLQLTGRDATAVVSDANKLKPTIRQVDANLRGPRVDTIFDEFFNDGCWSLDDLSRGNFRGDIRCKLTYWHWPGSPEK